MTGISQFLNLASARRMAVVFCINSSCPAGFIPFFRCLYGGYYTAWFVPPWAPADFMATVAHACDGRGTLFTAVAVCAYGGRRTPASGTLWLMPCGVAGGAGGNVARRERLWAADACSPWIFAIFAMACRFLQQCLI